MVVLFGDDFEIITSYNLCTITILPINIVYAPALATGASNGIWKKSSTISITLGERNTFVEKIKAYQMSHKSRQH